MRTARGSNPAGPEAALVSSADRSVSGRAGRGGGQRGQWNPSWQTRRFALGPAAVLYYYDPGEPAGSAPAGSIPVREVCIG